MLKIMTGLIHLMQKSNQSYRYPLSGTATLVLLRLNAKIVLITCTVLLVAGSLTHQQLGYTYRGRPGHAMGCDDAYISYRYARNLAAGEGLVFNPSERVEGYSNFLYVLILGLLAKFSDSNIYLLSSLLNIILLAGCLWLFFGRIKTVYGESEARTAVFLFALCPYLWLWAASGMETILVLLVQISIWILTDRLSSGYNRKQFFWLAGLIAVSILSRADGFVFPAIAAGILLLKRQYKTGLLSIAILVAGIMLYFAWRYSYYGYWLPNTYYVKVSGPLQERLLAALSLLKSILFTKGFIVYFATMGAVLIHGLIKSIRSRTNLFDSVESNVWFMIGWLGYWLYIGGDVFMERFLVIAIPLGIYSMFKAIGYFNDKIAVVGFPLVLLLFQMTPFLHDNSFNYRLNKYDQWVELGKFLDRNHHRDTLAVDAPGKIPYFSKQYTIDMLGLNDLRIARLESTFFKVGHNKFDADYVLSRKPDLIAAWGFPGKDMRFGLTREKYARHGYTLKYMVNTDKYSKERNIIDVQGIGDSEYKRLYDEGYQYFVLKRMKE